MVYFERWKIVLILVVCLLGVVYAAPNLMSAATRDGLATWMPGWGPHRSVNLGLDLQGGAYLLAEVQVDEVVEDVTRDLRSQIRARLDSREAGRLPATYVVGDGQVTVTLQSPAERDQAAQRLRDLPEQVTITEQGDGALVVTLTPARLEEVRGRLIDQSTEVIRRRVDETGLTEPVIQPEGSDRIRIEVPGYRDRIEDLEELISTQATLSFHLVTQPGDEPPAGGIKRVPLATEEGGGLLEIHREPALGGDRLSNAALGFDTQTGAPIVNFAFDAVGSRQFGELTTQNVGRQFAIVLDYGPPRGEEVISAPVIRTPIIGGSGFIEGSFTVDSANRLAVLMRAGALPAPLRIIQRSTVGPSLGADSIEAGRLASLFGFAFVVAFMVGFYRLFGVFASIALTVNIVLIFAVMSALQATLTLPGIAGIVLTMGMAVDANVLFYERIREELAQGRSVISAVDAGFSRAFDTILDANLTGFIAAALLAAAGTGPVRGFAVTLMIGICTSLFSANMVTRLLCVVWLRAVKPKSLAL